MLKAPCRLTISARPVVPETLERAVHAEKIQHTVGNHIRQKKKIRQRLSKNKLQVEILFQNRSKWTNSATGLLAGGEGA